MKRLIRKLVKNKTATHKPDVSKGKKLKDIKKQPGKSFIKIGERKTAEKVTVVNEAPPKTRKPRKKAPAPRVFAAWVVYDKSGKRVETFPYSQKWAAEMCLKKKGDGYYINLLKESESV